MAYETIEQLLSRRGEKVALMLTIENVVGMGAIGGPVFACSEQLPLVLRAVAVLLGLALGVLVTLERDGMLFYERLLWRVRGGVGGMVRGRALAPEDLSGAYDSARGHRAIAQGGVVRKARPRPHSE